jgi:hypothetical protein
MSNTLSDLQRKRLATFVHISDLHIGQMDPLTGNAKISRAATRFFRKTSLFDGLLGHHNRGLRELEAFVRSLKEAEPELRLLVTGDLSRFGHNRELKLARRFIKAHIDLNPPLQNMAGLGFKKDALIIPGNHDQWGGTPGPVGLRGSRYNAEFPRPLPFVERIALNNGQRIAFIGIDSDADVFRLLPKRIRAIGAFRSELAKLDAILPVRPQGEFRILLIHHSWSQQGFTLRMGRASKDALEEFMYSHKISAMLSGHSHQPLLTPIHADCHTGVRQVHELRAGSTTQLDTLPVGWKPRNFIKNTLLVHRIYQSGDALEWEALPYVRSMRGFTPIAGHGVTFPLE